MAKDHPTEFPEQHQDIQPGREEQMEPRPVYEPSDYRGSGKLADRIAIITGGDSGIGRAVALLYAREGADVAVVYLDEHEDAARTQKLVEGEGRTCLLIAGDVGDPDFCRRAVARTVETFGRLDILVNNAAVQYVVDDLLEISEEQLEKTFRTNIFSVFFMTQAALPHMKEGASIINSSSITAFRGMPVLIDYSATKGAILAFTRSLSQNLASKRIRVNAVAPGPVWTP
ncbi:MAG: SDR family NAD(P)-dependent oxidoreductase, partial [Bacteroidota bacterium]